MTPETFIAKWGKPNGLPGPAYALNEEQGAQSHFLDLCDLLGVPKPGSVEGYLFEERGTVIGGRSGYADVFMRGVFAWENKAPGKNLDAALKQLLTYSLALSNPPLLVVSDRLTIRIHTQFTGHPSQVHQVDLHELNQPDKRALLRRVWMAPDSFKPQITNRDITEAAARSFATLAEGLRRRGAAPGEHAQSAQDRANQVAHFLTQCLFCFFAEDVGLLPGRMFERLVNNRQITAERLTQGLRDLFTAMWQGGMFGADDIPWFNGDLFKTIDVPRLQILDVTELRNAAALNWSAIDVSIFGTLFERPRLEMRNAIAIIPRFVVTPVVAKHRVFTWRASPTLAMNLLDITARADDTTFGILHSRFHELWSLRMGTSLEDRPRYTPTTCFETFPFPAGLTPADTAHQRTEEVDSGARIPAGLAPASGALRAHAIGIATAAHRLNALREAWLNPPEWTHRVPEVIPLGMASSPYPDRVEPRPGLDEADHKALLQRTLTKLYNQRPAWLAMAHAQLDAAVAAAYGWTDYTPAMVDDEILRRLLALNLERATAAGVG